MMKHSAASCLPPDLRLCLLSAVGDQHITNWFRCLIEWARACMIAHVCMRTHWSVDFDLDPAPLTPPKKARACTVCVDSQMCKYTPATAERAMAPIKVLTGCAYHESFQQVGHPLQASQTSQKAVDALPEGGVLRGVRPGYCLGFHGSCLLLQVSCLGAQAEKAGSLGWGAWQALQLLSHLKHRMKCISNFVQSL